LSIEKESSDAISTCRTCGGPVDPVGARQRNGAPTRGQCWVCARLWYTNVRELADLEKEMA